MKGKRTSAHLLLTNRLFPDQSRLAAALSHLATFLASLLLSALLNVEGMTHWKLFES
jgi:hypothetical protein